MSGAPIIRGTIQLARPTKAGAEDHHQRMHCGHLIEEFRVDHLQPGHEQFGTDDHGHGAADQEHDQREDQVKRSDFLVIGREQPACHAARMLGVVLVLVQCGFVAHLLISSLLFALQP